MPISTTQLDEIKAAVQVVEDAVNAIEADPEVNPLQAQLDAALATVSTLTAQVGDLTAQVAQTAQERDGLAAKIATAKEKLAEAGVADSVQDAARVGALSALE
jgi:peptidoglycan hydrolase CwlO-like protein